MIEMTLDQVLSISSAQAQVVEIGDLIKTPKSDRLHSFTIKGSGWIVISSNINQTGEYCGDPRYKVGDKVVYIAIDSVLSPELEAYLIPEGSKITLTNSRVRSIKIRNAISQGMIVDINDELEAMYPGISSKKVGEDVSKLLGVTKYEPPASSVPTHMRGKQSKKNHHFKEYHDIKNFKWYSDSGIFEEGEEVYATAKLHGTSFRAAIVPTHCNTLWKKIKKFFGFLPAYEYVFGSRRCQLQDKPKGYKTFYEDTVYQKVSEKYKLKDKLHNDVHIYGEIVGPGIQKGYDYNLNDYEFFAYDVMVGGRFLDSKEFMDWCDQRSIPRVPYLGPHKFNLESITKLAEAKVCYNGQKVREGVVIKGVIEKPHPAVGRRCFKVISSAYLLGDQSDYH